MTTDLGLRHVTVTRAASARKTRAPRFASGASQLFVRGHGRAGAGPEAAIPLAAREDWRRQGVEFRVPRDADAIELGFIIAGTRGQIDADAVRGGGGADTG